jgi:hypothetical protein
MIRDSIEGYIIGNRRYTVPAEMSSRYGEPAKSWSIKGLFSRSAKGKPIPDDCRSEITLIQQRYADQICQLEQRKDQY